MVHRKQARGKRRGAVGVPETADHAHRRGDAARPGYMRATSCSGARAKGVEGPPAAPPERESKAAAAVFDGPPPPRVSRATCSSALKGPGGGGGCEGRRLCRYAYCSFKGHAPAPPPLGSFVASRRRLIKTEQRMKHKGVSPFRKANSNNNGGGGGGGDGFFVQIFPDPAGAAETTLGVGSDVMGYVTFDRRSYRGEEDSKANDLDGSVDGSCGSSDVISDGFAELPGTTTMTRKEEIDEEEGEAWVDQEAEDSGPCKSDISVELGARYESNISKGRGGEASVESSMDDISSAFGGLNFEDVGSDPSDAANRQRNKATISSSRRRTTPAEEKRTRIFSPRAPNFLPVRADPDAEKVDLRHQTADDRKSAEEWMVDYALRKAVKKLARARKRKVEMLVQAFETVLPPVPGENNSLQHEDEDDDKKSITQARTSQACN